MLRYILAFSCVFAFSRLGLAQTTRPSNGAPANGAPANGASSAAPSTQPSASDVLDQMLKPNSSNLRPLQPQPDPPQPDRTTGVMAVAPVAQQISLMREGSFIYDRMGRLTKTPDGQQCEFTFDSDGKQMQDPPVVILPNQKLMVMENAVTGSSRDLHFRITGMVTEYRGRNYVMLDKVIVVPDSVQTLDK